MCETVCDQDTVIKCFEEMIKANKRTDNYKGEPTLLGCDARLVFSKTHETIPRGNTYIILHVLMCKHLIIISYRDLCEYGALMSQCLLYTADLLQAFINGSMHPTVSEEKLGSSVMFDRSLHICMSLEGFVQKCSITDHPRSDGCLSTDPCSNPRHGTLVTSMFVH